MTETHTHVVYSSTSVTTHVHRWQDVCTPACPENAWHNTEWDLGESE